ncbi:MAG TPA: fibrobacter succinogenes major paralogous domain-containing protein [Bacteroidales bacterium]|nr:fibrobacter succinogenes major paralogous domain-containing protein [Bacteroidales bacterium]
MKFIFFPFCCFTSVLFLLSCSHTIKDSDGNSYEKLKIGNQIWMAENLRVLHFRNGDDIPFARTDEEWVNFGMQGKPAWCYPDGNDKNADKQGLLYNWYAVTDPRGLAPKGWHVTTDDEWTAMINLLGGSVKSAMILRIDNRLDKENKVGSFNGLPSGCRNRSGVFYGSGSFGYWWSSTSNDEISAWLRVLNYPKCDINFMTYEKIYGASVRCIKN